MYADPLAADARHVLRWLSRNPEPDVFTPSVIQQALRNHRSLGKTDRIEECLAVLTRHGYVRPLEKQQSVGRPTQRYRRRPLHTGNPGNTENPPGEAT
jgi:hypothetical protein